MREKKGKEPVCCSKCQNAITEERFALKEKEGKTYLCRSCYLKAVSLKVKTPVFVMKDIKL